MSGVTRKGYVSIHRNIMDHWIWKDTPFSRGQAWVDLILMANYKEEKFLYKGKLIEGKVGTVYRSISWLAERWSWSRDKTRRFLTLLQEEQMINIEATKHQTTITIINYEFFQNSSSTNHETNDTTNHATDQSSYQQQENIYNNNIHINTNSINTNIKANNTADNNTDIYNHVFSTGDADTQSPEEIAEAQLWFDNL